MSKIVVCRLDRYEQITAPKDGAGRLFDALTDSPDVWTAVWYGDEDGTVVNAYANPKHFGSSGIGAPEETKKLKTLDEANKEAEERYRRHGANGIACPKCGGELVDATIGLGSILPAILNWSTSCPDCGWKGTRKVFGS